MNACGTLDSTVSEKAQSQPWRLCSCRVGNQAVEPTCRDPTVAATDPPTIAHAASPLPVDSDSAIGSATSRDGVAARAANLLTRRSSCRTPPSLLHSNQELQVCPPEPRPQLRLVQGRLARECLLFSASTARRQRDWGLSKILLQVGATGLSFHSHPMNKASWGAEGI